MADNFELLKKECLSCEKCELCKTRTNVVFGVGNEHADVMLIGEAPGENEDLQGEPFVGRGGKLLDELCEAVGLSRKSNIYIANMLKCRPPKNRDPLPSEVDLCVEHLLRQIEEVNPKVIVLVGRIAAMYFLGNDFKMMKQHGNGYYKDGRIWFPIYHPAAILRNINLKPEALRDMEKLCGMLGELKDE